MAAERSFMTDGSSVPESEISPQPGLSGRHSENPFSSNLPKPDALKPIWPQNKLSDASEAKSDSVWSENVQLENFSETSNPDPSDLPFRVPPISAHLGALGDNEQFTSLNTSDAWMQSHRNDLGEFSNRAPSHIPPIGGGSSPSLTLPLPPVPTPEEEAGYEPIKITTPYGDREVQWPKEDAESMQRMRDLLVRIQQTKEADGGDVNKLALQELAYVISALRTMGPERNTNWEAKRELGERMYEEFITTLIVHSLFLQYEKPTNANAINGLLSNFTGKQLNFLLKGNRVPEETKLNLSTYDGLNVKQIMDFYEEFSDEFLQIRDQEQLEEFRQKARNSLRSRPGEVLRDADRISSQILGERTWRMLARRVVKDKLIDSKLKTPIEATPENKDNENISFIGVATGADYDLNRIINFKQWVYTQISSAHPFVELLEGWDLGSNDYLTEIPSAIEGFYRDLLFTKYTQGINNDNKASRQQAYNKAEEDAREIAKYLFGSSNLEETTNKETGEKKYSWKKGAELDITKFNYNGIDENGKTDPYIVALLEGTGVTAQIDFNVLGENPMVTWGYRKVQLAEQARTALMGSQEAFLRHPLSEGFDKLIDMFSYQGSGQFTTLATILVDYGNLLSNRELEKIGVITPNAAELETIITASALHVGLEAEGAQETVKKVLGDNLYSNLRILAGYYRVDRFIIGFISKLISGILQEIGKTITV